MNPAITLTSVCQPEQGCCSHFFFGLKGHVFQKIKLKSLMP